MSIRLRLTLVYSGLLAVVLATFSVLLYGLSALALNAELNRELDNRRDQVDAVVQNAVRRNPVLFIQTGRINIPPADVFASPGIVVQVLRASDGAVLESSDNASNQQIPRDDDILAPARNGQTAYSTFTTNSHVRFRMLTAPINIAGHVVGITQVAGSLQTIDSTLNRLALLLAIGTLSAVAIAAVIGSLFAGQALKPIDAMTRAAHALSPIPL